jgi:hypothetical protein
MEADILVSITYVFVTYIMMGIMRVHVVIRMSSDTLFSIKESAIALLMNVICLHQEYEVIRKCYVW